MNIKLCLTALLGLLVDLSTSRACAADPAEAAAVAAFRKLGASIGFNDAGQAVRLEMAEINVSNDDLANLKSLPHLERLVLWGSDINDAGLVNLKGLTKLTDLVLENTDI